MSLPLVFTFCRVLAWKPQKALAAAWWYVVGKRVRARNRLLAAASEAPFAYEVWIRSVERRETAALRADMASAAPDLRFAAFLYVPAGGAARAEQALSSILAQTYRPAEIFVAGPEQPSQPSDVTGSVVTWLQADTLPSAWMSTLEQAKSVYLVPVSHDALLAPDALLHYARAARASAADATMPLIYGDQDELGPDGARQAPWLKPEWDRELFLAQDFVSSACAIPLSQAQGVRVGGCRDGDPLFGLLVDLTANPDLAVRHVPAVTTYAAPGSWRRGGAARQAELALRLAVSGCKVEPGPFGTTSLAWPVPQAPAGRLPVVSIIVPTRDRVDLLGPCLDSLLGQTSWPAFEVLVVDNGSVEPQTLQYFQRLASDPRVRVLTFDQPYNFSAINNFAAQAAAGEYLCLLNNDTEVIDGEWLTELMRYALRPDCGAVGARLLYPDQSIQHAGVVVGLGGAAGHAHRGLPASQPGYFARAYAAHRATAVTAACLVVRKDRFLAVGGLDAEGLAIAYNDIDLCLKLRGTGCHNYYAPRAVLIHHESKSRGLDLSPQHLARYQAELAVFQERWNTVGYDDPLHHRWLDRSAETYRLSLGESWS